VLLHALQQRRLGLGGGPVDLVADHDVGEDAARAELELPGVLVEDRHPGDIAREQVGSELDAAHRAVDRARERLRELGLADSGHVLDQEVPLGEQHGQRGVDDVGLSFDHLLDAVANAARDPHQCLDLCPIR
jgi:hypothetical protein